jgi:hypothetical protein
MEFTRRKDAFVLGIVGSTVLTISVFLFGGSLLIKGADQISYISSIMIAPSFLIVLCCILFVKNEQKRLWIVLSIVFGIIYAVYCMVNYYLQLTFVRVNDMMLNEEIIKAFRFVPGSALFAQDMLGYSFLCISCLFLFPAFKDGVLEKYIRIGLIINGIMFLDFGQTVVDLNLYN